MYKLLAALGYGLIALAYVKRAISLHILKEDPIKLEEKFNKYGPFYTIDWGEKDAKRPANIQHSRVASVQPRCCAAHHRRKRE